MRTLILSLILSLFALQIPAQSNQTSLVYLDPRVGTQAGSTLFYLDDYLYVREASANFQVTVSGKYSGEFLNFLIQVVDLGSAPVDFFPDKVEVSILLPKSGFDSGKLIHLKVFNSTELFSKSIEELQTAFFVSALSTAFSGSGSGQVATAINNGQYLQFAGDNAKGNLWFIANQLLRRNTLGPGTGIQGVLVVQSADPPEKGFKFKNLSSDQRAVDAIAKGTPLTVKIPVGSELFSVELAVRNDWKN